MKNIFSRTILLIPLLAISIVLHNVYKSYDRFVYGDEAETILHAKSILKNGYPKQTDPETYHSFSKGAEFGPGGIETFHTWSYMYFAAAILKAQELYLSQSDYNQIRFLFLLIGVLSAIPLFLILKKMGAAHHLSLALLAIIFCNNFLFTYLFNLKYFSFSIFFCALFVWSYIRFKETQNSLGLIVTGILMYYTQWSQAVAILFVFCSWDVFQALHLNKTKIPMLLGQIKPWIIIFFSTSPHFFLIAPLKKFSYTKGPLDMLFSELTTRDILIDFNKLFFAAIVFLFFSILFISEIKKKVSPLAFDMLSLSIIATLITLMVSTQTYDQIRARHLLILLPFYLIITTLSLQFLYANYIKYSAKAQLLLTACAFVFLSTNHGWLSAYIENDLTGSDEIKKTILWLQNSANPGASIYANTNRETLLIHTKLKLVNAADRSNEKNAVVIDPILPEQDPTHWPFEKTEWIFWNKSRDYMARVAKTWASPEYVSLKKIPNYFSPAYETQRFVIYKNNLL